MSEFTLQDAESALLCLSSDSREEWLQVGMALRSEFGDAAFDIFDSWSQSAESYKASDCRTVWRSFSGSGVGIGTLIKMAKDAGWSPVDKQWSEQERAEYRRKTEAAKAKRKADEEREQAWRQRMQLVVAEASRALVDVVCAGDYGPVDCPYLNQKQVGAFGVYLVPRSVLVVIDDQEESFQVLTGEEDISQFFAGYAAAGKPGHLSVRNIKRGSLLVPLIGEDQALWSVQIIFPSGKKSFFRHGRKSGCFHVIPGDQSVVCVAEGYATAASVHMATGYFCVVAVDAGNIPNVLPSFVRQFSGSRFLICADDDSATEENAGLKYAQRAAAACGADVVLPQFSAEVA